MRLALDPAAEGESRDGNERLLIVSPVAVTYEAFEESQVVLIYRAAYRRRNRM